MDLSFIFAIVEPSFALFLHISSTHYFFSIRFFPSLSVGLPFEINVQSRRTLILRRAEEYRTELFRVDFIENMSSIVYDKNEILFFES